MADNTVMLNSKNFAEKVNGDLPILVDFWAPWCGPCMAMAPVLEEIATELDGKALIGKMNVDENMQIAEKFGIMGIPTLILFKKGEEIKRIVGLRPKQALLKAFDGAIS